MLLLALSWASVKQMLSIISDCVELNVTSAIWCLQFSSEVNAETSSAFY